MTIQDRVNTNMTCVAWSVPPRFGLLAQAIVVVIALVVAELIARSVGLDRAAGVLCLTSLASLLAVSYTHLTLPTKA